MISYGSEEVEGCGESGGASVNFDFGAELRSEGKDKREI